MCLGNMSSKLAGRGGALRARTTHGWRSDVTMLISASFMCARRAGTSNSSTFTATTSSQKRPAGLQALRRTWHVFECGTLLAHQPSRNGARQPQTYFIQPDCCDPVPNLRSKKNIASAANCAESVSLGSRSTVVKQE